MNDAELPVTVIVWTPVGVAPAPLVVAMDMTLMHVGGLPTFGVQDAGVNVALAPAGSPPAEKLTGPAVPAVFVVVMVVKFCVVSPWGTVILPELASEKLKLISTAALSVAVLPPVPVQVTE